MKKLQLLSAGMLFGALLFAQTVVFAGNPGTPVPGSFMAPPAGQVDDLAEYNALKDLYEASDGPSWLNKTNWLTPDLAYWYGVTVDKGDVTALNLTNNNLVGTVPASIGSLTQLTQLFLAKNQLSGDLPQEIASLVKCTQFKFGGNQFTGLPDFSSHPQLSKLKLNVEENKLDFGDLEPLFNQAGIPIVKFLSYNDQAEIGEEKSLTFYTGMPVELTIETPGSYNTYQWQKMVVKSSNNGKSANSYKVEWVNIDGAASSVYRVENYVEEDVIGSYRCAVSNTRVPNLTLYTKEIKVNIETYTETRFTINTTAFPVDLAYQIVAPELNDTLAFGGVAEFILANPQATTNVILNVLKNNSSTGVGFVFAIDANGTIHDLKLVNGVEQSPVNPLFYSAEQSQLALYPVSPSKKKWPSIHLGLKDGLFFTPDGDGSFDVLSPIGAEQVSQFSLEIWDADGAQVFASSDPAVNWDGMNASTSALVPGGVYHYTLMADDVEVKGQFIIRY